MWVILVGRFLWGGSAGLLNAMTPKFASELLPPELKGPLGVLNQINCTFGILLVSLICLAIPNDYETLGPDAFINKGFFRVIFVVPMVIAAIQILFMLTVFNYDTPV